MKVRISGKIVSDVYLQEGGILAKQFLKFRDGDRAEIEVEAVDVDKIPSSEFYGHISKQELKSQYILIPKPSINAVTPVSQEGEWCECKNRTVVYGGSLTQQQINALPCGFCNKPLKPPKVSPPEGATPVEWVRFSGEFLSSFTNKDDLLVYSNWLRSQNCELVKAVRQLQQELQKMREER